MALRIHIDETTCGPLCQHPSCWHSNTRQEKGFPRMRAVRPPSPDIELDLPTLKVCNMLDDYGEDERDLYPSKFSGKPAHGRNELYPPFDKPIRTQSVKVTRAPQTSPKSGTNSEPPLSKFKVVEVQEVFDPEDLSGTWDDTFVPKSYYVWVPNPKKKKRRKKLAKSLQESGMTKLKGKGSVKFKDMTEDMVPKELESNHITTRPLNEHHKYRKYASRKKRASARSPVYMRPYTITPRTAPRSSRMELDHEGSLTRSGQISVPIPSRISGWRTPRQMIYMSISELLDLPRDILVQVLENTRQSDLMSRDKIREIIRKFMPPGLERGNTNISLASQDLLQQKKLNLHEGNKNIRQSHLMETKPVFHLDDDMVDDDEGDEDMQRSASPYGSLKDLYFGNSKEFSKYKKPLPSITGGNRAVSAGEPAATKIPSISLGLPELPSGIRQTKPFTYSKKADLDFTLAPVPTPPTSVRSTETPGSDHGTTIRVNIPSQTSQHSEQRSDRGDRRHEARSRGSPEDVIHRVSPTFSTGVPKAPATTPATYPQSPSKSAPILRDVTTGSTQEWPPREKSGSPLHILRAPVNTPGSMSQEPSGLQTIQEVGINNEGEKMVHPVSRGRSVRFEIPEVPPPPSSPQLSDDGQKEVKQVSRNTVTVNTTIPQHTPSTSTKPLSGSNTIKTDQTTINTSTLQAENSFVRSNTGPVRELSMISSPEPWPQINEADYDIAPVPSPVSPLHSTPLVTPLSDQTSSEQKSAPETQPKKQEGKGKKQEIQGKKTEAKKHEPHVKKQESQGKKMEAEKREQSPEKEKDSEYVNKTGEKTAMVKKMMEESRKAESPAPPPPSPEAKEDSEIFVNKDKNSMTPLVEDSETHGAQDHEVSMTVMQIAPKGPLLHVRNQSDHRQIDTFQNIDIPAEFDLEPVHPKLQEPSTETIPEEPEPPEETEENKSVRDATGSTQSTLANRTISEQGQSEELSSMVEPAISQASQGPALSEDFSDQRNTSELFDDWNGIVGSSDRDTQAMLSSEKPDMTEDGGDHEGFKDDLRQEYEKITQEIDSEKQGSDLPPGHSQ